MAQKIQTLDEMMADYDKERIAEIDSWEANRPQWIKDKIEADRQDEIRRGLRDSDGNWIVSSVVDENEENEDEDDDDL